MHKAHKGFLLVGKSMISHSKPGRRIGDEEAFKSEQLKKLTYVLEHAAENQLKVIFCGGLFKDSKSFSMVAPVMRLLARFEAPLVVPRDNELLDNKLSDNSPLGILSASGVVSVMSRTDSHLSIETENGKVRIAQANEGIIPKKIRASKAYQRTIFVTHSSMPHELFDIQNVDTVIDGYSYDTNQSDLESTLWISAGSLIRTDPTKAHHTPAVVSWVNGEVELIHLPVENEIFVFDKKDDEDFVGVQALIDDSRFVSMLEADQAELSGFLDSELEGEIQLIQSDDKITEATKKIVDYLFKEIVFEEMGDLVL